MPAEDEQLDRAEIVENVRRLSGVSADNGPDDAHIFAGVKGFVSAFDYWYIRVMREAVPQYRNLIIMRINPLIRVCSRSSAAFWKASPMTHLPKPTG